MALGEMPTWRASPRRLTPCRSRSARSFDPMSLWSDSRASRAGGTPLVTAFPVAIREAIILNRPQYVHDSLTVLGWRHAADARDFDEATVVGAARRRVIVDTWLVGCVCARGGCGPVRADSIDDADGSRLSRHPLRRDGRPATRLRSLSRRDDGRDQHDARRPATQLVIRWPVRAAGRPQRANS